MGGMKNNFINFLKAASSGWIIFFVIVLFIITLAHIGASIFLFKKNYITETILIKKFEENEKMLNQLESKVGAIYSQVYRLRNQQFENYKIETGN